MFEDFKISVFMKVASEGSFTKAATALGITQPAVSQNISELEKQAGEKLFNREKGSVSLTDHGRLLLEYALKITTLSESADRLFTQLPAANLTVFASDEIWQHIRSPARSNFSRIHPRIVFRRTSARECDLAVVMVPASSAAPVPNAIAKIRMSICAASLEKTLNFDLLYLPSESFARTNTCALLRGLLTDISLV